MGLTKEQVQDHIQSIERRLQSDNEVSTKTREIALAMS